MSGCQFLKPLMNKVRQFWEIISKPSYKYANQFLSFFFPTVFLCVFFPHFFFVLTSHIKSFKPSIFFQLGNSFGNLMHSVSISQLMWEY